MASGRLLKNYQLNGKRKEDQVTFAINIHGIFTNGEISQTLAVYSEEEDTIRIA